MVISGSLSATTFSILSSFEFGIFSVNSTVYAFDSSTMNGTLWSWTTSNPLVSYDCMYPWIMVFDNAMVLHQINMLTGFYHGNFTVTTLYTSIDLIWYNSSNSYEVSFYKVNTIRLDYATVNDSYTKCANCACNSGYNVGAVSTTCNAAIPLTLLSKLTSTAPVLHFQVAPTPTPTPAPLAPTVLLYLVLPLSQSTHQI